jgi:hypothetical protein
MVSQEKPLGNLHILKNGNLRRRTEELDYWRKRAGWYDDDTYYKLDDDQTETSPFVSANKGLVTFLTIGSMLVSVGFGILLYRSMMRRLFWKEKSKHHDSADEEERPRSRSKSVSRSRAFQQARPRSRSWSKSVPSRSRSSRSRSRSNRDETSKTLEYELMEGESEEQEA